MATWWCSSRTPLGRDEIGADQSLRPAVPAVDRVVLALRGIAPCVFGVTCGASFLAVGHAAQNQDREVRPAKFILLYEAAAIAGWMSVSAKSPPLNSNGSPLTFARA